MAKIGDKTHRFKKAWKWPKYVEEYIKQELEGYTCHLFCGSSFLGDVRVDQEEFENVTHNLDIMNPLPFKNDTFDVVFADPPWAMAYHHRSKIMYEMRRICKIGGKIILNSNWSPNNLKGCKIQEPFLISCGRMPFSNAALITTWIKEENYFPNS